MAAQHAVAGDLAFALRFAPRAAKRLNRHVGPLFWYDVTHTSLGCLIDSDYDMTASIMAELASRYRRNQENLLKLVSDLTDKQIAWTPNKTTPSVGFHVWHLARWADYLQELINGRGSQLWEAEGLATQWNMETKSLGYAQTGMEMDEKSALALRIPEKGILLDYARRSFAAAQHAVEKIEDDQFFAVYECFHGENWHDGHIGPIVMTWMTHDNRHLGMIECLIGLQGQSGSADA